MSWRVKELAIEEETSDTPTDLVYLGTVPELMEIELMAIDDDKRQKDVPECACGYYATGKCACGDTEDWYHDCLNWDEGWARGDLRERGLLGVEWYNKGRYIKEVRRMNSLMDYPY